MSAAAHALGDLFQPAPFNVTRSRSLRVAGVLEATSDLEEIPVMGDAASGVAEAVAVRAFRVRSGMERLGLQKGDCLLIQPKDLPEPPDVVVVEVGSVWSAHRVVARYGTKLQLDPPVPERAGKAALKVVGSFAGILRKRLTADRRATNVIPNIEGKPKQARSPSSGTIRLLRGKLGMVELTCAGTTNPRLRRALRNEAENLRRQLQIEAAYDKRR